MTLEIFGNQTFNATLTLVGLAVLAVGMSMLRRDASIVAGWEKVVGTVVDRNHRFLDGADRYYLTVGFVDRDERQLQVALSDYEESDEDDRIEFAVSPRNPRKLVRLGEHRPASKVVKLLEPWESSSGCSRS